MVSQQLPAAIYAAPFHEKTSGQVILPEAFAYQIMYSLSPFTPHVYTIKDIYALILLRLWADMSRNGM